jgi:sirohydrochlorin cobaltochelatase
VTSTALLLVGDGVRDDNDAAAFGAFVSGVSELADGGAEFAVAGGCLEPPGPLLADAVAELAAKGTTRFVAVPLALVPTRQSEDRVRAALAVEQERHPGTSYLCTAALGPDPAVLSVLEQRVEQALSGDELIHRAPDDRSRTTVLLVGRGSRDPYANAEVHRAARLLWEGRGYAGVETAFVSHAAPDVMSGLERCRRLGASSVVVLPYLLFADVLSIRVRQQSAGWATANPGVEVRDADVIGSAEELSGLVLERYREAVADGTDGVDGQDGQGQPPDTSSDDGHAPTH